MGVRGLTGNEYIAIAGLVIISLIARYMLGNMQKTIDRQQDTIQHLINRDPVTYEETGQKPPKPQKEVYAAWGNQVVNLDEDESRS